MAHEPAPFQTSITYFGGRLVVVSREGEGYRFPPAQLEQMVSFFDLMHAWTEPQAREIVVGPCHCRPTRECEVFLDFELGDGECQRVPVSSDWLKRMLPVFEAARGLIRTRPLQAFTLVLEVDGSIKELPPDRITLRPA